MTRRGVDEAVQVNRAAGLVQFEGEMAVGGIEFLADDAEPRRVPVHPDDAAGPGPGPALRVGSGHLLRVLAKEGDLLLEEQHVGFPQPLRLLTRALPEFEQFGEGQDVLGVIFADPDVPGIGLTDVQTERVRPHGHADADVAVAEQHPFEEVGGGEGANDLVPAGDRGAIELRRARGSGRRSRGGTGQEELSARG